MEECVMLRIVVIAVCLVSNFALAAEYIGSKGAVASRSTIASEVGRDILKMGGNAIDAAVATGFALAVTYPSAGNIGGGGFAVLRLEDGSTYSLDFRETAPLALKPDHFLDESGEVVSERLTLHPLGCGVPGSVSGLLALHDRFGSLPLKDLITPAIELAKKGFPLSAALVESFKKQMKYMKSYPASSAVFSNQGEPFEVQHVWTQPDLAKTLKRIQKKGVDGFYRGKTADLLIAEIDAGGGVMTRGDLVAYQSKWREPIIGSYRNYQIISMPPPSSGGVLLVHILQMLEQVVPKPWRDVDTVHLLIEAERLAYADRSVHLGDPDSNDLPMEELLSAGYAKKRFNKILMNRANVSDQLGAGRFPEESPETTHYSVMDAQGNSVSVTTTLNWAYGNKRVVNGAGFLLNNEVDDFAVQAGVPNSYGLLGNEKNLVRGGRRMLSSMSPTIIVGPEGSITVLGSPGGSTIITTVLQVILNLVDHEMTLNLAVQAPRFHHQWKPDRVFFEPLGYFPSLVQELEQRGHRGLVKRERPIGDVNAIQFRNGHFSAVTDPRFDALPAVY